MTDRHPLVSVVMPTYNGGAHLREAVESVLAQTFQDFEVVIVDDASQDDTVAIASAFSDPRVTVIPSEQRLGPEGNWNRALAAGRGDLVKVMAQDDLIYPTCLEQQVAALGARPIASFATVRRDVIDATGRTLLQGRGLAGLSGMVDHVAAARRTTRAGTNIFGEGAAVLMRREAATSAGGFRAARPYVIDLDLWLRLLERGPMVAIDAPLAAFRLSEGAWSVALARKQARQVRELLREIRDDPDNGVTRLDFAQGWLRAGINAWMRRIAYYVVGRRSARIGG